MLNDFGQPETDLVADVANLLPSRSDAASYHLAVVEILRDGNGRAGYPARSASMLRDRQGRGRWQAFA